MTAPEVDQAARVAEVPTQRAPAPARRRESGLLPPEGRCGHNGDAIVSRTGRGGGQSFRCRICGTVGVIEP